MRAPEQLRVLHIEDDDHDAFLFAEALSRAGHGIFHVERVASLEDGTTQAVLTRVDLVVMDLHLVDADQLDAVDAIVGVAPHVPVVVHTGRSDLVLAARAVRRGAQDVLFKGAQPAADLVRSLILAIERFEATRHLRRGKRDAEIRADELSRKLEAWMSGRASLP